MNGWMNKRADRHSDKHVDKDMDEQRWMDPVLEIYNP